MTAVYSEFIFQDNSLHPAALAYQRTFDLTLLTGLDMPWQPDGIQRDGERVRAPVDTLLRQSLQSAGITFEVIYGQGDERLSNALLALQRHNHPPQGTINSIAPCAYSMPATVPKTLKKWQWNCEKCSDPDCEHRLFSSLQSGEETTQTQKAQHNMPKSERTQVLFVCSRNQWRSPTAEQIWRKHPALSVRSGGTSPNARHPVSENDVTWADVIFVMEEKHKSRLIAQFRHLLDNTTIHVLDIPDDYKYMDVELVALLREAISSILELD